MRIVLIGYGKMGHMIEQLAVAAGDEVVARVASSNRSVLSELRSLGAEVAIEFSRPETAFDNIVACLGQGVPVVCGTTGWLEQYDEVSRLTHETNGAFLYGSNFSLGVNVFFSLNRHLASLMSSNHQYSVAVHEIHHVHKLDAPSGTAKTLAEPLLAVREEVPITAERIGEVPGTHIITWQSAIDTIEIKHEAHTREGFAAGALIAARWLVGKKGVFDVQEVFMSKV